METGYSVEQLFWAAYTAKEVKDCTLSTPFQMKRAGYLHEEMIGAGFTELELREAGYAMIVVNASIDIGTSINLTDITSKSTASENAVIIHGTQLHRR